MFNRSRSQSTPASQDALASKAVPTAFQGVAIISVPLSATEERRNVFSGPFYGFQVIEVSALNPETANVRIKCGRMRGGSVVDSQTIRASLGAGIAQYGYGEPEEDSPFDRLDVAWPVGVSGSLSILVHLRPPTMPFLMPATLLDRSGAPISTLNPLPVSAAPGAPAVLVMGSPVTAVFAAAEMQVLAANASRRALWVGIAGGPYAGGARASFAFGVAAQLDRGITFVAHQDAANRGGAGPMSLRMFITPEAPIHAEVRAVSNLAGMIFTAQEAT